MVSEQAYANAYASAYATTNSVKKPETANYNWRDDFDRGNNNFTAAFLYHIHSESEPCAGGDSTGAPHGGRSLTAAAPIRKERDCDKLQLTPIPTYRDIMVGDNAIRQESNNSNNDGYTTSGLDESPYSSFITSPFSVLFLLAQLALYAKGTSYEQLANLLNIKSRNEIRSIVPNYLDDINSQQNVTIQLAEKVYGSIQFPFKKSFKRDTRLVFHAEAENLDFSDPIQAANSINSWIASRTNNLVKDLVSSSLLNQNTRLVLANAIYFKGDWKIPFHAKKTKLKDFYVNENITVSVNMMNQINKFNYGNLDSINAKVLQLFYKNTNVSFVAVLPNEEQDVLTIAETFRSPCFSLKEDIINKLKSAEVNVSLPVMDIETSTDLEDILAMNGVTEIFNPDTSDLTGIMKQDQKMYVSSALQKAKIIVNESGSEAAAGNAAVIEIRSIAVVNKPKIFNANHPFLHFVLFKDTIIFAGLFSGPQ
ncbi:unnamed protein product [Colias eurytheme]|nr:unnamed protein product [Colias eurytheme]